MKYNNIMNAPRCRYTRNDFQMEIRFTNKCHKMIYWYEKFGEPDTFRISFYKVRHGIWDIYTYEYK